MVDVDLVNRRNQMLNEQELVALVQLLNRCPMSSAELLWTQALISKLRQGAVAQQQNREGKDGKQDNG